MNGNRPALSIAPLLIFALLTACNSLPPTGSPSASSPSGAFAVPAIPAPVPVALDAKTSALLILDIVTANCPPNPACTATVPAIASLLQRARAANVPVIYSSFARPAGTPPPLAAVASRPGEPMVVGHADKFIDTNLRELLKQRNATTLVIVGSAANGAVLYTSYHANARGYTVVVAEDGISSRAPFATLLTRYQLLNQPVFANPDNKPLAGKAVTLSRSDLITFR